MSEDDELQRLLNEFMSVQEQKTNPLAERTVAEIMVKLHHSGFRFFSTNDGNEYVTPERLDQQIIDLILERGHVNISIIPQILNIGLDTIQGRVIKILTKRSSQSTNLQSNKNNNHQRIFRNNNSLFSQQYLMSILQNIRQTLVLEGRINLETIALNNQFNIKFTEKLVRENVQFLDAELINNQLITKEYNLMRKLQLLGYLRAISTPISFQNIIKNSKIAQNDESKTLERLINQIIQQKKVKGKYQNSYYIPDSFIVNQKQRIYDFFSSNGYIQFQMLKKQFLVSNPEDWLEKHLPESKEFAEKFVIFEDVCIMSEKLNFYANNIVEQLNHEGFIEISQLLPFNLEDKELDRFLNQYCKLKDYFLFQGYCYSEQWLSKVMDEFKDKVFKSIFGNTQPTGAKNDSKNPKKKAGKKDIKSVKMIEEDMLVEKLYNEGLAEYSVAENIAPALIPILTKKLDEQKKKYEKQLAQNKGILNSSFLKYRSCNTIMRNIDGLQRNLNIIEKQKKKNNEPWIDKDFGPNQNDEKGIYCVIYYDNILPKGWPSLQQTLDWQSAGIKTDNQLQSGLFSQNCLFCEVLATIQNFNKSFAKNGGLIPSPLDLPKQIQKNKIESPFVFSFYRNQNDRRYVIVDDKLPFIKDKLLGHSGIYGLAEKAYAKFRYCYKGIIGLGIKILMLEMTGKQPLQYTFQKSNENDILAIIETSLKANKMIVCLAEGEVGKAFQLETKQGQYRKQISYLKPYLCTKRTQFEQKVQLNVVLSQRNEIKNNQGQKLQWQQFKKIFKNIYIL